MGTRSVFVFKENVDSEQQFCVYKHYDGYPSGAADALVNAIPNAWDLPRYEPDEFAAAFVAANKEGAGNIRLTSGPDCHGDLEYVYELSQAKNGQLIIKAFDVSYSWDDRKITKSEVFYGRLKDFVGLYGENETKAKWDRLDRSSPHKLLDKTSDPEYKEYVRLKNKFERV